MPEDLRPDPALVVRLLARTERRGSCLVWTGPTVGPHGCYAQIRNEFGQREYIHRISHRLFIGPIPDGYQVDHVKARGCRFTLCVEPAHLEAVTPRINIGRSTAPGSHSITHGVCRRGHVQTPQNVYTTPSNGNRQCRPCKIANTVASNKRIKAQRSTVNA
jgi:hypothetical protein